MDSIRPEPTTQPLQPSSSSRAQTTTTATSRPPNPRPPYIHHPVPPHPHTQTLILLHGLGNNHTTFHPLFTTLVPSLLPTTKILLPNAPLARSTVFRRKKVTQWFDLAVLGNPYDARNGVKQGVGSVTLPGSVRRVGEMVEEEARVVGWENVVVGGISMGMATAVSWLLGSGRRVGGFVGLSGWVPMGDELLGLLGLREGEHGGFGLGEEEDDTFERKGGDDRSAVEKVVAFERKALGLDGLVDVDGSVASMPVFIGHGDSDEKISDSYGRDAVMLLEAAGFDVTWKSYEGLTHKLPDDLDALMGFLRDEVGWGLSNGEP